MKKFFRENGALLLLAALLLSGVIAIGGALLGSGTDPLSNAVGVITTPVRAGIGAALDWAQGVYTYVFRYQEMQDELEQLRQEVARLEDAVRQGQEASRENEQLRQLLELREQRRDFTFESARVTARSTAGWESTLTLSKGSSSGVEVDDCVITETGVLVGVVTQVGLNYSTVDTVISPNIEMGGQVSRTNTAGVLEGELSLMQQGLLTLSYLPLGVELLPGDEVITSGRGEVYPSGLVVGTVEEVRTDPSGMSCYAEVRPDVDLGALVEVFIIKEFDIVE